MKKNQLLFVLLFFIGTVSSAQTTATNFTANDCSGTSHTLFTELDAGKVVVIAFVMPCATCIAPTLSAYNNALSYASSHPGRVVFYLSDDYGTTPCSTLNTWATTNGMAGVTTFSNTSVVQTDYGTPGMPKIVVLGGASHTVFHNENSTLNVTNYNAAIVAALGANSIDNNYKSIFNLKASPNPATNKISIDYTLDQLKNVSIDIFDILGKKVKSFSIEDKIIGKNNTTLDIEFLKDGIYFIQLNIGEQSETLKFEKIN